MDLWKNRAKATIPARKALKATCFFIFEKWSGNKNDDAYAEGQAKRAVDIIDDPICAFLHLFAMMAAGR